MGNKLLSLVERIRLSGEPISELKINEYNDKITTMNSTDYQCCYGADCGDCDCGGYCIDSECA